MFAFSTTRRSEPPDAGDTYLLEARVDEFIHLILHHDVDVASRYVQTLRAEGIPLADIYLGLLAPAARKLGAMWESDEMSFADVTVAVCHMQQVLLEFTRCFDARIGESLRGRSALILPAVGEQHTFGLFVLMEFLRRADWDCYTGNPASPREFRRLVDAQEYTAIGISISADRHIDRTISLANWIRKRSRNRQTILLVGGRSVDADPSLVKRIGADGTAADGRDAARCLENLVAAAG